MARIRPISYQVLMTPLIGKDEYGTEIDVTKDINVEDFLKDNGISSIKKEVDNGDFDIGVFVFDSINLTCINYDGTFSDFFDYRSIFKFGRDKAKVVVNYFDGTSNTPDISFKGLVDDRATKLDFTKSEIKLIVLSQDSILNRVKVSGGTVSNGSMISTAIKNILNIPAITSVLNYNEADINVLNDYVVDDASKLENKTIKEAIDLLLGASNSVLVVDKLDNIIVRSREYNTGSVFKFFGENDLLGRQNIISIRDYNSGLQRAFNTIIVGEQSASNIGFIEVYGDNKKNFKFDFITNVDTQAQIAADILDFWKTPKIELQITAKTSEVRGLGFFDLVSIDYYYRVVPVEGTKLPLYGTAIYGTAKYPYIFGNNKITPNTAFKVIGIEEDPKTFTTKVKLRQTGKNVDDGYFSVLGSYYGTAQYGFNVYQSDPDYVDPNIVSVYGAAKYGVVHYGNV